MRSGSPFFEPDRYFDRLTSIDIDRDVLALGFRLVLLDIDNTVRSRVDGRVPFDVSAWLGLAKSKGVRLCFVSNNWHSDVYEFARGLDIPVVAKACKPLPFAFVKALRQSGFSAKETLMVGDQLSTDVWGAHVLGICAYLVQPLVSVDLKHTRYVRKFEASFLENVALESTSCDEEAAGVCPLEESSRMKNAAVSCLDASEKTNHGREGLSNPL